MLKIVENIGERNLHLQPGGCSPSPSTNLAVPTIGVGIGRLHDLACKNGNGVTL